MMLEQKPHWYRRLLTGPLDAKPSSEQIRRIQNVLKSPRRTNAFSLRMIYISVGILGVIFMMVLKPQFFRQTAVSFQVTAQPSDYDKQAPYGIAITSDGIEWKEDKNFVPFDELISKVPFRVMQPEVPFEITQKGARSIHAPFELIEMTYANVKQGLQLTLAESNSKDNSTPPGEKGPTLKNGAQTWVQSSQAASTLYWRYDGITFILSTLKVENGKFVPLYDIFQLAEIANTIK